MLLLWNESSWKEKDYLTWATRKQQNKSKKVMEMNCLLRNEDNLKAIFTILFPVSVNANEIGKNQR